MTLGPSPYRYVPKDWADKAELTLEEVSQLNSLNIELTSILSGFSPVFQPFQHGNFTCIMIKEVREGGEGVGGNGRSEGEEGGKKMGIMGRGWEAMGEVRERREWEVREREVRRWG